MPVIFENCPDGFVLASGLVEQFREILDGRMKELEEIIDIDVLYKGANLLMAEELYYWWFINGKGFTSQDGEIGPIADINLYISKRPIDVDEKFFLKNYSDNENNETDKVNEEIDQNNNEVNDEFKENKMTPIIMVNLLTRSRLPFTPLSTNEDIQDISFKGLNLKISIAESKILRLILIARIFFIFIIKNISVSVDNKLKESNALIIN
ncbi:hypothetical protein C2G38_2183623 [Gigaspora rosea]|uniref:Uncharacterized protein n=1 Tax=Gigaspora rosea TaxID=44941 RepID=A0A397VG05_9GLOM|nr:hypothetical protein C2G38_2183623 [Gigaspora rosea]